MSSGGDMAPPVFTELHEDGDLAHRGRRVA
ncbi:hypothetical protein C8D89_10273 [Actinomycetospora cinnamomea]|uniref:Uncharacterized protein n=1 Tax=Actinomycetospora cinnamomea TaxID=663609 RepID=A0A2U1FL34_9PSEU|nr:hypothetical protein C8D89_10273 [Actinomycetospora cinnamomea]